MTTPFGWVNVYLDYKGRYIISAYPKMSREAAINMRIDNPSSELKGSYLLSCESEEVSPMAVKEAEYKAKIRRLESALGKLFLISAVTIGSLVCWMQI
jgi:hypothetical protein